MQVNIRPAGRRTGYAAPRVWPIGDENFRPLDHLRFIDVYCVAIGDAERDKRDGWLVESFEGKVPLEIVTFKDEGFPVIPGPHAMLVVSGNDSRRMAGYIRLNLPLYRRIPRVCLMNRSSASKRALLIRAGFDDVIDISRISPAEALGRMAAICRRYDWMRAAQAADESSDEILRDLCFIERLAPMQRKLIEALAASRNRAVSYEVLGVALAGRGEAVRRENLKVLVSKLRKHLHPGVTIVSLPGRGYKLVV